MLAPGEASGDRAGAAPGVRELLAAQLACGEQVLDLNRAIMRALADTGGGLSGWTWPRSSRQLPTPGSVCPRPWDAASLGQHVVSCESWEETSDDLWRARPPPAVGAPPAVRHAERALAAAFSDDRARADLTERLLAENGDSEPDGLARTFAAQSPRVAISGARPLTVASASHTPGTSTGGEGDGDDGDEEEEEEATDDALQVADKSPRKGRSKMLAGGGKDGDIRERLKRMLKRDIKTTVEDLYFADGFAQAMAKSSTVSTVTVIVILLNTVWIAVDTDLNHAEVLCEADPVFQIADNVFCTYFFLEIAVRLLAFRQKCDALSDTWFQFDFALVTLMVWETWVQPLMYLSTGGASAGGGRAGRGSMPNSSVLRVLRIFRLTRVARMARLLRSVPELMILVKGMVTAMRSVCAMLVLLVLVIYIFAVLFVQLLSTQPMARGAFENVPQAMHFLLMQVLCGFDAQFMDRMLAVHFMYYVLFLMYVLSASYTLMNMLIGVLCEVVSDVAKIEKEDMFLKELESQINGVMQALDVDGDAMISAVEFEELMENHTMVRTLADLDVDIIAFVDFAHFVFMDSEEVNFSDFFEMVVQFRGSKASTVKDIVDMRKFVTMEMAGMASRLENAHLLGLGAQKRRSALAIPAIGESMME